MSQSRRFAFMLNSITEIDRKGLFWTPREPMSPSGNRTAVSRYARACPRPHGRLMLTVLGGLAEFERELIRARTGEGRKCAKERGARFGRPQKLNAHQRQEALARREAGETLMDIARSYGVSHPT